MKCTICNHEMEWGNLVTEGGPGLFYLPGNEKYHSFSTTKSIEKKDGVILDGPYKTRLHNTCVGCFRCKTCKKIVISY